MVESAPHCLGYAASAIELGHTPAFGIEPGGIEKDRKPGEAGSNADISELPTTCRQLNFYVIDMRAIGLRELHVCSHTTATISSISKRKGTSSRLLAFLIDL